MHLLSLLKALLTIMAVFSTANAQAQSLFPSLNIVEFDQEHQDVADQARNIASWKKVRRVTIEELGERLKNDLSDKPIDRANTRNINLFLPYIHSSLRDLSRQINEQWTQEYLELVQRFNQSKMDFQDFKQSINKFDAALNNLSAIKKRQYTTKEVYLQNLEGIDTTFLVLGIAKWDGKIPIEDLVNPIADVEKGVGYYISDELAARLIFSETTVVNSKIYKEVIISHSGGRVESVETDPYVHQKAYDVYVLQKYRCFPRFKKLIHQGAYSTFEPPEAEIIFEGITENNVDEIFYRYPDLSDSFRRKVTKDLQEISEQNSNFYDLFQRLSSKYNQDMDQIKADIEKIESEIDQEVELLLSKIKKIASSEMKDVLEFNDNLSAFINLRDDENDRVEKAQKENLIKWFQRKLEYFKSDYIEYEQKLLEKNNRRSMLLFTIKEEFLHKDQSSDELAQNLLSQALRTLNDRKKLLTSFTISVVENKELISRDMVNFYDSGKIRRYLMLSPVQSFVNYGQSGGDTPKLSLLLAMVVEFYKKGEDFKDQEPSWFWEPKSVSKAVKRKTSASFSTSDPIYKPDTLPSKEIHSENQPEKNDRITVIAEKKVALMIPADHCSSFEQLQNLNLNDFNLPNIEQLRMLRTDLLNLEYKMKRFNFTSDALIWTNQKTILGRKVYRPVDNKTISMDEETGCAFFLAIKPHIPPKLPIVVEEKSWGCGCR